jgi:hypothetical protein
LRDAGDGLSLVAVADGAGRLLLHISGWRVMLTKKIEVGFALLLFEAHR